MHVGYSFLFGELINVEHLEPQDCEHFLVVCPQCGEPVRKVSCEGGEEGGHLAHSSAKPACDLQGARYTPSEREEDRLLAQSQRLRYFLERLYDILAMAPMYLEDADAVHQEMNEAAGVMEIREMAWQTVQLNRNKIFEGAADDFLYKLEQAGWEITGKFPMTRQHEIAGDLWAILTSHQSRARFDCLFNHALLREAGTVSSTALRATGVLQHTMEIQARYIDRIFHLARPGVLPLLNEMLTTKLPPGMNNLRDADDNEASSYLSRLLGNTITEMVGTLMALPYFEMLRQRCTEPGTEEPLSTTEQVGRKASH